MLHLEKVTYKNIWEIVDLKVFRSQKSSLPICCAQWGIGQPFLRRAATAGLILPHIKMSFPHAFWFK